MLARDEVDTVVDTVLLESDLPDLLLARDRVGTTYLCSLAEVDPDGYFFLAVKISSNRLAALRCGEIDLRTALLEPEIPLRYTGRCSYTDERIQSIHLTALLGDLEERWLPESGFDLSVFEASGVSDDVVVRDAISKNAPVIVCTLNPPESRGIDPKVDADDLAKYIAHFQSLVRHATKHVLKSLPKSVRDALPADLFALDVYGFSFGSFNVHFAAKDQPNMFGWSRVGGAMRQIDELMSLAAKPADEARAGFRQCGGHVVAAYEALMKFSAAKGPLSYRWSDPGMATPNGRSVTRLQAAAMVAVLEHEEELKAEPFKFVGRFTSVNTDKKPWSWTARDEEGKVRRGVLHPRSQSVLNGVTIKTRQYQFAGEDHLVEPTIGRQAHKLLLVSISEQQL